jgi:hypothetical protein
MIEFHHHHHHRHQQGLPKDWEEEQKRGQFQY